MSDDAHDTSDDPMPGYEFVMPFVTCASNGGPHEDNSYVAGWDMGVLDARLAAAPVMFTFGQVLIHRDSRPMADLILARHGWHIHDFVSGDPSDDDGISEWHWCDIQRDDSSEEIPLQGDE